VFQVELLRGVQCTLRGLAGVAAQDAAEEPLSRQPVRRRRRRRALGPPPSPNLGLEFAAATIDNRSAPLGRSSLR